MASIGTETGSKRLTGKQASFVDKYIGEARFNASLAAKLAGYKATSKHSFESIGSENLAKPQIRKVIDDYFRMSRMSAEEVLLELGKIARSDSKDKVRALALLSSHFGLLDGSGRDNGRDGPVEIKVTYVEREVENAITKVYGEIDSQVQRFNECAEKNNQRIEAAWKELLDRFKDSPAAIEALTLLHAVVHEKTVGDMENEPEQKPIEPEIIPPDRRLRPAMVERLMSEVKETDDAPQASPVVYAANEASRVTPSLRFCNRVDGEELEQLHEKIERRGFRMY